MIDPLDALLESVRAGTGAMVVVEGQTARDDPYYYSRWFGHLAREVRFVHQDGYRQVKKAVAYLRANAHGHPVFGLIDRDFATRDETDATAPLEPGLYRTGWYTLENYFFTDLAAWSHVAHVLTGGDPPTGWRNVDELARQVLDAYEASLPVAAWNRVVHDETIRAGVGPDVPRYREHFKAIDDEALLRLDQWGTTRAAPHSLLDFYHAELSRLHLVGPDRWPEYVTGKAVLKLFAERFPALAGAKNKHVVLCRLYNDAQTKPPPDLVAILDEIRREAAKLRRN